MNVGYEYFFKENLNEQLDTEYRKSIGKYHYSSNAYINIAHEKKEVLKFDYLIFEFVVDNKVVLSKEQIIQNRNFLYHEIQRKMEFFFYSIYCKGKEIFKDEKWFNYTAAMYYESMYKENKSFISFVKDAVFTFKIWNKFSSNEFSTISNFYSEKNSISRACIDIETEYTKDIVREYLDNVMISHIQKCLSNNYENNNRTKIHDVSLESYLYDILLKTL